MVTMVTNHPMTVILLRIPTHLSCWGQSFTQSTHVRRPRLGVVCLPTHHHHHHRYHHHRHIGQDTQGHTEHVIQRLWESSLNFELFRCFSERIVIVKQQCYNFNKKLDFHFPVKLKPLIFFERLSRTRCSVSLRGDTKPAFCFASVNI